MPLTVSVESVRNGAAGGGAGVVIDGAAGGVASTVPSTEVELVKFPAASVALAVRVRGPVVRPVKSTVHVPATEFCVAVNPFTVTVTSGDSDV